MTTSEAPAKEPERKEKGINSFEIASPSDKAEEARKSFHDEFTKYLAEGKRNPAQPSKRNIVNDATVQTEDGKTTYDAPDLTAHEKNGVYTLQEKADGKIDQTAKFDEGKKEAQFLNKDNQLLYKLNGVDKYAEHLLTKNRVVFQLSSENIDDAKALDEKLKRQSKPGELPEERIYVSSNGDMAIFTKDANQPGKDINIIIRKNDSRYGKTDVRVNDGEIQKIGGGGGRDESGFQFTDKDGSKLPVTISRDQFLRDQLKVGDTTVELLTRELRTKSDQGAVTILSGGGKSIVDRKGLIQVSVDSSGLIRNLSSDASLFKSFDTKNGIIEGSTKSGRQYTVNLGNSEHKSSIKIVDRDHFTTTIHRGGHVTAVDPLGNRLRLNGIGPTRDLVPGGLPKYDDDDDESEDTDKGKNKRHSTREVAASSEASGLLALAQGAVNPESIRGLLAKYAEYSAMFSDRAAMATDKGDLAATRAYSQGSSEMLAAADILARKSNKTTAT